MLQIFAGPIVIPDTPEARRFFGILALVIIVIYIVAMLVFSLIIGQVVKLFTRYCFPKNEFAQKFNDRKGVQRFTLTLFGVSTVTTAVLLRTTWHSFDSNFDSAVGNSLFVLFCATIAVTIATAIFIKWHK